jgi:hypothetical protein
LRSAGAFSLDLAQRTADVVNQKLGGEIDTLVMHHSVRREYIKLLNADRRYSGSNLSNPNGGTVAMKQGDLTLGECTVKAIRSIGLAQVYFLDTKRSASSVTSRRKASSRTAMARSGSAMVRARRPGTRSKRGGIRGSRFLQNPGFNARWDGVTGQTLVVVRAE